MRCLLTQQASSHPLHVQLPMFLLSMGLCSDIAAEQSLPWSYRAWTTATSLLYVLLWIIAQAPYLATLEPQQGMPGSSATLAPICSLETPSPMPTTSLQGTTLHKCCQTFCRVNCLYLRATHHSRHASRDGDR